MMVCFWHKYCIRRREKINEKIFILLCFILSLSFTVTAFASEEETENIVLMEVPADEEPIDGPFDKLVQVNEFTKGSSKPNSSDVKNLKTISKYSFNFQCLYGVSCYSAYNFTGVTDMALKINASSDVVGKNSLDYTVKIYERKSLSDKCVGTFKRNTATDHKTIMKILGVNSNKKYYFKVYGNQSFSGSGYIKKG